MLEGSDNALRLILLKLNLLTDRIHGASTKNLCPNTSAIHRGRAWRARQQGGVVECINFRTEFQQSHHVRD